MRARKLTAMTSLLKMLKAGCRIQCANFDNAPCVRRSGIRNQIVAERGPTIRHDNGITRRLEERRYPMTRDGLTAALNWAYQGYLGHMFDLHEDYPECTRDEGHTAL